MSLLLFMENQEKEVYGTLIRFSHYLLLLSLLLVIAIGVIILSLLNPTEAVKMPDAFVVNAGSGSNLLVNRKDMIRSPVIWKAPDVKTIPIGKAGETIRYGRQLIISTARFLGPRGSVAHLANGMNCGNCHLDAGTRPFGNNFGGFIASYPKKSRRSGRLESPAERISACFERSLNGRAPDTNGREVQAILAYMKWVGKDVKKGREVGGASTEKLAFLDRAAEPQKGKIVFVQKCQICHGSNGEGRFASDKRSYVYPPLWGADSYNDGAGLYRLSNFAGFVKNNMPFGATYDHPQLTNAEAWDVAAFINSQPRPHRDQRNDFRNTKQKPIDHPFGPYADNFSEKQHKYGPFKPIQKVYEMKM